MNRALAISFVATAMLALPACGHRPPEGYYPVAQRGYYPPPPQAYYPAPQPAQAYPQPMPAPGPYPAPRAAVPQGSLPPPGMQVSPTSGRYVHCSALRVRVIPNPQAPLTRDQAQAISDRIQPTLCAEGAAMSGNLDGGHRWLAIELPG